MEIEESSNEPPLRLRKSNEFNSFFLSFFPIVIVVAGSSFSYFSPFDILSSTSSSFSFSPNSFRCAQRNAPILYLVSAFLPPLFLDRYMCVVEPFSPQHSCMVLVPFFFFFFFLKRFFLQIDTTGVISEDSPLSLSSYFSFGINQAIQEHRRRS